jgi:Tfp pilus assembly protein PilO
MSSPFRSSLIRAWVGGSLLLVAAIVGFLVLPDASRRLAQERKARENAQAALQQQLRQTEEYKALATQVAEGRSRIEALEHNMPKGPVGELQWSLSRTLFQLAQKHDIRIQSIKYGQPSREGAKGTDLEAMDVELNALGVFANIKPFMLALEGSGLPFAVGSVRLEESPEGARLTVTLRAFRKASSASAREEA